MPWLCEAQQIARFDPDRNEEGTHSYRDGLLTQNPPLKNVMSGVADPAKKPGGIWIIQVNPEQLRASRDAAGARWGADETMVPLPVAPAGRNLDR